MSRLSEIYKEQQKHQREKRVNELLKIQYVPKQNELPMPMLLLCDVDIVMEILENTIFLRFVTRTS